MITALSNKTGPSISTFLKPGHLDSRKNHPYDQKNTQQNQFYKHFFPQPQPMFPTRPTNPNYKSHFTKPQGSILGKPRGSFTPGQWPFQDLPQASPKPKCQICNKIRHSALERYHRADYIACPSPKQSSMCAYASLAQPCYQAPVSAMMATTISESPMPDENAWLMDSGATHPLTPRLTHNFKILLPICLIMAW